VVCASSSLHGTFRSGGGLRGGIGSITAMSFSGGCHTLTASRLPWRVNAISYTAASGATTGTITGIHLVFTDPGFCEFVVDGTGATAGNGRVRFTYTNAIHKLRTILASGGSGGRTRWTRALRPAGTASGWSPDGAGQCRRADAKYAQ
jgi:hypothetical protein